MTVSQTARKAAAADIDEGDLGQKRLMSGDRMTLRLWEAVPDGGDEPTYTTEHESLGFVISGEARLELEGQEIRLEPGDCWLVPKGARHRYLIEKPFTAVEVTAHGLTEDDG